MKHTWHLFIIGTLTTLSAQASLTFNENLIENPGFETTSGWNGSVYQTTAKVHSGTYALYGGANAANTISQTLTLSDITDSAQPIRPTETIPSNGADGAHPISVRTPARSSSNNSTAAEKALKPPR